MKDYSESTLKDLQDVIAEQQLEIERLTTENKLFRQASEEQRKLNGSLRIELSNIYTNNESILAEMQTYRKHD